jgi:hypothetical protein
LKQKSQCRFFGIFLKRVFGCFKVFLCTESPKTPLKFVPTKSQKNVRPYLRHFFFSLPPAACRPLVQMLHLLVA